MPQLESFRLTKRDHRRAEEVVYTRAQENLSLLIPELIQRGSSALHLSAIFSRVVRSIASPLEHISSKTLVFLRSHARCLMTASAPLTKSLYPQQHRAKLDGLYTDPKHRSARSACPSRHFYVRDGGNVGASVVQPSIAGSDTKARVALGGGAGDNVVFGFQTVAARAPQVAFLG